MRGMGCIALVGFWLVSPILAKGDLDESATRATALTDKTEVTQAQVYQLVVRLREEVDLIRLEMGRSKAAPPLFQVENAAPREEYFQALTLFRKADRLAFEFTHESEEERATPIGEIRASDVLAMVESAFHRVESVKKALGIPEQSELKPLDPVGGPSPLFNSIVAANRELNHLLDQQFSPSDVYRQVSVAIAYSARLLDLPDKISTPPDPPALERRKKPADVYLKLVQCFEKIRQIGEKSGVSMLELKVDDGSLDQTEPSDVYDMASLLVSELAHLHGLRPRALTPRKVYEPGRKLPSDVYQRVGILFLQMEALRQRVETNPAWLKE